MATVKEIKQWIEKLPDESEFVVWHPIFGEQIVPVKAVASSLEENYAVVIIDSPRPQAVR